MKNIIVVTGGAGFIGSNLINRLVTLKNFKIISIDDYSTGTKKNHISNKKVKYIKSNTKNIPKVLQLYKNKINVIFHFGEFSRIYQSFLKMNDCINSNTIGSNEVFNFCLSNKIKLIYSATSASIGNNGNDKNLSPYAFTKAKNLEMLENLKKWYKFKFEIIYFYNVYGPKQIEKGNMSTVIGIFENQYRNNKPLTVVKPGTQSRRFTHVEDTIETCLFAWKKNKCRHYSISSRKNYTIFQVAKMFGSKIKFLAPREGERFASALTDLNLSNKIYKRFGKISLKEYVKNIVKVKKK
ncbi:NAD-dependent epimerase/dehydratase family protein [Candidatus Pelagibacter ubique]|nr:NAD-dependent epimerase/dehydratase family protein [Candidatus Pelagibacter ubique]MDB9751137.1 NAD-dependent epimerase/dehydratase family protein [Candidatus Pelagibacter ubique]